jgi:hypothetical protein
VAVCCKATLAGIVNGGRVCCQQIRAGEDDLDFPVPSSVVLHVGSWSWLVILEEN